MKALSYVLGVSYIACGIMSAAASLGLVGYFTPDPFAAFALLVVGAIFVRKTDSAYFLVASILGALIMLVYLLSFAAVWLDSIIVGEEFAPAIEDFNIAAVILGAISAFAVWHYTGREGSVMAGG